MIYYYDSIFPDREPYTFLIRVKNDTTTTTTTTSNTNTNNEHIIII